MLGCCNQRLNCLAPEGEATKGSRRLHNERPSEGLFETRINKVCCSSCLNILKMNLKGIERLSNANKTFCFCARLTVKATFKPQKCTKEVAFTKMLKDRIELYLRHNHPESPGRSEEQS